MTKHKCNHDECEHEKLKYCKHCKRVYCPDCGQEWYMYWRYGTYTMPYYSVTTYSTSSSGTGPASTNCCSHAGVK